LPEKPDPKTDIKKILKTLSKMLIDTEDTISSQFEKLNSRISSSYEKSIEGDTVYEDPCTEISMGERIPDSVDFFSSTNHLLISDWQTNQ
jgi:hypothetical protein